jgi:hypothetical protein
LNMCWLTGAAPAGALNPRELCCRWLLAAAKPTNGSPQHEEAQSAGPTPSQRAGTEAAALLAAVLCHAGHAEAALAHAAAAGGQVVAALEAAAGGGVAAAEADSRVSPV